MRYYQVEITNQDTGAEVATFTSFINGKSNPGALNVELDIPVAPFATPIGGSIVRIWGVPLKQISQATDLTNRSIAIFGGFQKGLPLANPKQAGLLARGTIFPAFGNWIGTDMTLDLILAPPFGTVANPANLVHNWPKNTPLAQAIKTTLQTAFPKYKISVNISDKLKLPEDVATYYQSIGQYSEFLREVSQKILGEDKYSGVTLTVRDDTITVYDSSAPAPNTREILFQDLIGQPTWISFNVIQFKTMMRADLALGDQVRMPQGIQQTITSASAPQFRSKTAFQGAFTVNQIRHIGSYRQPDAASWVTVVNAASTAGAAEL